MRTATRVAAAALAAATALSLSRLPRLAHLRLGRRRRQAGTIKIMVGGIDKVIYLPAKLTEQLGYFKEQGINVKLLDRAGRRHRRRTSLISGDVAGRRRLLRPHHRPADQGASASRAWCSSPTCRARPRWSSTAKAGQITSPADFKGKKLGVTSARLVDRLPHAVPRRPRAACRPSDYTTGEGRRGPDVHRRAEQRRHRRRHDHRPDGRPARPAPARPRSCWTCAPRRARTRGARRPVPGQLAVHELRLRRRRTRRPCRSW